MFKSTMMGLLAILAVSLLAGVCHAQTTRPSETKTEFTAEVYGQKLSAPEPKLLLNKILGKIRDDFVKENDIQVTESEIDLYIPWLEQDRLSFIANQKKHIAKEQAKLTQRGASEDQRRGAQLMIEIFEGYLNADKYWIYLQALEHADSEKEKQELTHQNILRMREQARFYIGVTKYNRVVFEKYGGRVALMGDDSASAYDAQRAQLDEQLANGNCKIFDAEVLAMFKEISVSEFLDEKSVSEEEGRKLMTKKLWWEEKPVAQ